MTSNETLTQYTQATRYTNTAHTPRYINMDEVRRNLQKKVVLIRTALWLCTIIPRLFGIIARLSAAPFCEMDL